MVITMAKLGMAHAKTHGARKPPGPITIGTGITNNRKNGVHKPPRPKYGEYHMAKPLPATKETLITTFSFSPV